MKANKTKHKFVYTVHAVIFGADETLVNLQLRDGFRFCRKSLNPRVDHLDELFNRDDMGLRRDYEAARVDKQTMDVICAVKTVETELTTLEAGDYFENRADCDLISLDNQIRAIRLLEECSICFRWVAFHMAGVDCIRKVSYSDVFPNSESSRTRTIRRLHCDEQMTAWLNQNMPLISFPLEPGFLNLGHQYYDLSYHQGNHISIVLLTTALEMFYIKKGEKKKKERLARRCAVNLCDNDGQIQEYCQKLRDMYKKRSDFVHDGEIEGITDEDIIFLRKCARETILPLRTDERPKAERIAALDAIVANYWDD